jgi:hypothetical protein
MVLGRVVDDELLAGPRISLRPVWINRANSDGS